MWHKMATKGKSHYFQGFSSFLIANQYNCDWNAKPVCLWQKLTILCANTVGEAVAISCHMTSRPAPLYPKTKPGLIVGLMIWPLAREIS